MNFTYRNTRVRWIKAGAEMKDSVITEITDPDGRMELTELTYSSPSQYSSGSQSARATTIEDFLIFIQEDRSYDSYDIINPINNHPFGIVAQTTKETE